MRSITQIEKEDILDSFSTGLLVGKKEKFTILEPGDEVRIGDDSFTVSGLSHGRGRILIKVSMR